MPFGNAEGLLLCGSSIRTSAESLRSSIRTSAESLDRKMEVKSKWKKAAVKSLSGKHAPTKTSKLREEMNAGKGARKTAEQEEEDNLEEWARIRNMEQKREIEALKKNNEDLKNKEKSLKEKLKVNESKLDDIKEKKQFCDENGVEHLVIEEEAEKKRQANFNQFQEIMKKLESEKTELEETCKSLHNEKENLITNFDQLKMEKEIGDVVIETLQTQKQVQEENEAEFIKEKEEIQQLLKMYAEKMQEGENERIKIENENKVMLTELKVKCDNAQEMRSKLQDSEQFVVEQNIAMEDMIKLVSDLELEKGDKEDELEKSKEENKLLNEKYEQLQSERDELNTNLSAKHKEIEQLLQYIEAASSTLEAKESKIKSNLELIADLNAKVEEKTSSIKTMKNGNDESNEKNKEIINNLEKELNSLQEQHQEVIRRNSEVAKEKGVVLSDLQETKTQLENKLVDVQSLVNQKNGEINDISKDLQQLKEEMEKLQGDFETTIKGSESLQEKLKEELKNEKQKSKKLPSDLDAKIKQHLSEIEVMKSKFDANLKIAEEEITKKRKQIEIFEDSAARESEKIKTLKSSLETSKAKSNELRKKLDHLEIKHKNDTALLQNQLDTSNSSSTEKEKLAMENLSKANDEIIMHKQKVFETEEKSKILEASLLAQIQQLSNDLVHVRKKNQHVAKELERSENECQFTSKKLEELTLANREINKKLVTKTEALENANNQNELLQSSVKILHEKLSNATENIMKLEQKSNDLKKEIKEVINGNENLESSTQERLKNLNKSLQFGEEINAKLEYDHQKLQDNTMKLSHQIHIMTEELELTRNENQEFAKVIESITRELTRTKSELDKLKINHETEMNKCQSVQQQQRSVFKSDLETQGRQYQSSFDTKAQQISELETELSFVQNELLLKVKDLRDIKNKYEQALSQYEEKEKALSEQNEVYFTNEIARLEREYKNKITQFETERETLRQYEEKYANLELEYENTKFMEIQAISQEYKQRLSVVSRQRDELTVGLKKMESLLIKHRADHNEELRSFKDEICTKTVALEKLQIKHDAQYRVVEFMITSLEEERAKQKGSNQEILSILTKLERQFNEKFSTSQALSVSRSGSVDSFLNESCALSLFTRSPKHEMNATWPPGLANNPSELRRFPLESRSSNPVKLRENIEKTRSELSLRLKDLNTFKTEVPLEVDTRSPRMLYDDPDGEVDILQSGESALSPVLHQRYDFRSYSTPRPQSDLKLPSHKLTDSGITEGYSSSVYYKSQLRAINDTFSKLEKQCKKLKSENSDCSNEKWYQDLEVWKQRLQYRLKILQQHVEIDGEVAVQLYSRLKPIVFHPSNAEVKAIIDSVNEKYENSNLL